MIKCLACRKRTAQEDITKGFTCKNCTEVLSTRNLQLKDGESYNSYSSRILGILAVAS